MAKEASGAVLEDRSWVYDGDLRVIARLSDTGKLQARNRSPNQHSSPHSHVNWGKSKSEKSGSTYPIDVPHN